MFKAAGKTYRSRKDLLHKEVGEYQSTWFFRPLPIYEDKYGRQVIHLFERFPCFDIYDSMYENRYYNWYFIKYDDKIAVVYIVDEQDEINVCDDLKEDEDCDDCCIDETHFTELKACGFL
ncbi:MAG: hypothetical protein IJA83_12000 [Clostridia bacterium]|nr:hypothetical protein [Clostridia bacterium]